MAQIVTEVSSLAYAISAVFCLAGLAGVSAAAVSFSRQRLAFGMVLLTVGAGSIWFSVQYSLLTVFRVVDSGSVRVPTLAVGLGAVALPLIAARAQRVQQELSTAIEAEKHVRVLIEEAVAKQDSAHKAFQDMQRTIVTNVGHEFKTPLTILMGWLGMLLGGTFGDVGHLAEPLTAIDRNAKRIEWLVNRIQSIIRENHFEPIELFGFAELVTESDAIWITTRREKEEVTILLRGEKTLVITDRAKLKIAVSELLNNAIKFGSDSIGVTIKTDADHHLIVVEDNGIGIDRRYHQKIFEPLFQIDPSSTRRFEGMGMGLAAVVEIMESLGGFVSVASTASRGSTFTLGLPKDD